MDVITGEDTQAGPDVASARVLCPQLVDPGYLIKAISTANISGNVLMVVECAFPHHYGRCWCPTKSPEYANGRIMK
jgi:hypothetical protein